MNRIITAGLFLVASARLASCPKGFADFILSAILRGMLYNIFSTIFPVFGLISAGLVLKRSGFIKASFFTEANKLAFWVALPCLLFQKISGAQPALGKASRILAVMLIATTAIILLSWLTARLMKLPPTSGAAFVHSSFRGNLAYIGLPVIMYSLQSDDLANYQEAQALAVMCLAPVVPFYNIVAILFLQSASSGRKMSAAGLALESLKNPLLVACLLGLTFSALKIHIPVPVDRALGLMSQAALPLTLLALGASLSLESIRGSSTPAGWATFFKLAVCPGMALAMARALDLGPAETRIAVCYMAAPTAIAAYVMTDQMKCDAALVGSATVLTTILSIITFSAVIILT